MKQISRLSIAVVFLFPLLVSACGLNKYALLPTPPSLTPIVKAYPPDWLEIESPEPGGFTQLSDYPAGVGRVGVGSAAPIPICIYIFAGGLIVPGDHWDATDVIARTEALVDEQRREFSDRHWSDERYLFSLGPIGKPVASVGGPFGRCLFELLGVGLHKVEIRFNKSTGEQVSFAWTFTVLDGAIPTATPYPG